MSHQTGMSFKEFQQQFHTEEACEAYLFEKRWPDRFVCPKCGGIAAIGFTDVGSMSVNSAIVKVQSQWELCCTALTFC